MKVALLGYGRWGKNLYRAVSRLDEVSKVFVCDPYLKENSSNLNLITFDEILNDDDITAVLIASPATTHFDFAKTRFAKQLFFVESFYARFTYKQSPLISLLINTL